MRKEFESAFRLSRPLAAYKGMVSPSRYRVAGTCVPCSATCTWYASLRGAYRSVSSAVLYPASGKQQKISIFAANRSCTCSHNLTAMLVCLFAAYMPGFPARLRDRRLWRFLLGFLPVYIITYPCPRVRPSDSLPTGIGRGKGILRNEIFRTDSLYAARAENPRGLERVASKERECGLCIYIKKPGGLQ